MNTLAFDEPDFDEPSPVVVGELVEAAALIPYDPVLKRLDGITALDRAQALILGHQALAIKSIDDDPTEEQAGSLILAMTVHKQHIESKVNPFSDLANKLHKALTGFRAVATAELITGLEHLRPLLARRLRAKQDAEEARQRAEREAGQRQERERLLAEAVHAEQTGASKEEVDQMVVEAEHVAPPPVAARPITGLNGAGTRDNWKALPEHSDEWGSMSLADRRSLVCYVAERVKTGDDSYLLLLEVSATTANQFARAQKQAMKIPGLRAVNPPTLTTKRRS